MNRFYVLLENGSSYMFDDGYVWHDKFYGLFTSIENAKSMCDKLIEDFINRCKKDVQGDNLENGYKDHGWDYKNNHYSRRFECYLWADEVFNYEIFAVEINPEDPARLTYCTGKEN